MINVIRDGVLIRIIKKDDSKSKIIVPETTQEQIMEAEIVACGLGLISGGKHMGLNVKKGDLITFHAQPKVPIMVNGEELVIIQEGQILLYTRIGRIKKIIQKVISLFSKATENQLTNTPENSSISNTN